MSQIPTILHEEDSNYSSSYHETIDFFERLSSRSDIVQMTQFGMTDSGNPLHEIIIDTHKEFDPDGPRSKRKTILFINNGIHPGEPCGVDASQQFVRDLVTGHFDQDRLEDVLIIMIPMYNIGGSLNRGSHSRANQVGPRRYGFRGNAQNLDLNRDFIKCDSKNAQSFNQLFNKWNPHVFIDTHTSNGADYQYTMTLIPTQKDKLAKPIAQYMTAVMLPELYLEMQKVGWEMTPYVYARETPDDGIRGFLDLARYSSGYAALHHAISFMPETHMLKPYKDRVASTYAFMNIVLTHTATHSNEIRQNYKRAIDQYKTISKAEIDWDLDKSKVDSFYFKGYEAAYKKSNVTGQDRLYYDRSKPYAKNIAVYNTYKLATTVDLPKAYIIPYAYSHVVDRLRWNGVEVRSIDRDQSMQLEYYYIEDYKSSPAPYEGHYLHSDVKIRKERIEVDVYKGDYIVDLDQEKARYIIETLEPEAPDSFFAWNFFDGILMQKEYFSAYVFEDLAHELLQDNADLKKQFEQKKKEDQVFASDARAQLNYIYQHSPHYEQTYKRYPVARLLKN